LARRGRAYAEQAQWQPALADFARASALRPDDIGSRFFQGLVLLEQEDMAARAVSGVRGVGFLAWPHDAGPLLAALHLFSQKPDRPKYRHFCAEMLERFGNITDARKADLVVTLAVLLPGTVKDLDKVVRLARVAVNSKPDEASYLGSLGAAFYRAGKYKDAREYLDRAVARHGKGGSVRTQLFLALAHQRLGHPAEAKTWLARAVKQLEAMKSPSWEYRVYWRHLRQEAEDLLKASQP
jgi:tetratricopeptide (TPR) repeat protein